MPGVGRYQWQWIGKPPVYWTVIFWITLAEFVIGWVLDSTLPRWARATPDSTHPVEMQMKFGHVYYLSPGIDWFVKNEMWVFFGLLGILILIMFFHRNKILRVR